MAGTDAAGPAPVPVAESWDVVRYPHPPAIIATTATTATVPESLRFITPSLAD
jgi:hypothetical protein